MGDTLLDMFKGVEVDATLCCQVDRLMSLWMMGLEYYLVHVRILPYDTVGMRL